jgi:hypothetical protein
VRVAEHVRVGRNLEARVRVHLSVPWPHEGERRRCSGHSTNINAIALRTVGALRPIGRVRSVNRVVGSPIVRDLRLPTSPEGEVAFPVAG